MDFLDYYLPELKGDYRFQKSVVINAGDFSRGLFSAAEIEQVNRFRARKKQIEWMAGRCAAKTLLMGLGTCPSQPEQVEIHYEIGGAPYPAHDPLIPLSIAHAGNLAVAAAALQPRIRLGIDLETIAEPVPKYLAQTAFTAAERREIKAAPVYAEALYHKWTIKEAFLKYIRQGFAESLHRVEILHNQVYHRRELMKNLKIVSWRENDYCCSVVFSL